MINIYVRKKSSFNSLFITTNVGQFRKTRLELCYIDKFVYVPLNIQDYKFAIMIIPRFNKTIVYNHL